MADKRTIIKRSFRDYQKGDRRTKGQILDRVRKQTLYRSRAYLALVLRQWGRVGWQVGPRGPLRLVAGAPARPRKAASLTYGESVRTALIRLWYFCDCLCGKRLVPAVRTLLPVYERCGELKVSLSVKHKLLTLSAATADRLLKQERSKVHTGRGRSYTRSTTLLRQIPLRTFDEWDRSKLGQVQADLVGHDGGQNGGEFAFTCTVTELSVGWTELRPLPTKARVWVAKALEDIRKSLPFPVIALGTDTGSEFINHNLLDWCLANKIAFSRTRPYRRNDNCFVEEKNNSLVRHCVGYLRYDTPEELTLLGAIYQRQTLLSNYFYPYMKLVAKSRRGARVYRQHDLPRTPCQRLLEREEVPQTTKDHLRATFEAMNPAALKRELTDLQQRLYQIASAKPAPIIRARGKELVIHPRSD
jgi:hypothetical protein